MEVVLASTLFVRSPRLSRLLQYLCNKYFEGATEEVKEYQIGVEVLGRPPSFDPAEDAAARVEAHRLRKRLKEYYETEGRNHSLRIELPLGHYAVVFQTVTVEPPPEEKEEVQTSATPASPSVSEPTTVPRPERWRFNGRIAGWIALGAVLIEAAVAALGWHRVASPSLVPSKGGSIPAITSTPNIAKTLPSALGSSGSVRIACGRTKTHTDRGEEKCGTPIGIMKEEPFSRFTGSSSPERTTPRFFKAGAAETSPTKFRLPRASTSCICISTKAPMARRCLRAAAKSAGLCRCRRMAGQFLTRVLDIYADAGGSNIARCAGVQRYHTRLWAGADADISRPDRSSAGECHRAYTGQPTPLESNPNNGPGRLLHGFIRCCMEAGPLLQMA